MTSSLLNSLKEHKKALLLIAIILTAGISGIFIFMEISRSQRRLILATTTSTYDSGLLDYLLPVFEEDTGINVEILSVGTGQALEIGRNGDADVLLVHSRSHEDSFVNNSHGVHRTCVMYNDFIIVGPSSDPANIEGKDVKTAMKNLKDAGEQGEVKFYSRGDGSGTHSKELTLWDSIDFTPDPSITPDSNWYFETGEGMGTTLTITNQEKAYTLVDRGTWLFSKENVDLALLVEGEEILLNPYGAILINPEQHPHVKYQNAHKFISFLVSEKGQDLIGAYTINDEILFKPAFGICNETHSCPTTAEEVAYWSQFNGGYKGPSTAKVSA